MTFNARKNVVKRDRNTLIGAKIIYYRCSNKKYSCERTLQVYRGGREENRGNTGEHHIINKNS